MTVLFPFPKFRAFNVAGTAPLVGGQLFTYVAGTTTALATYTDSTGGTPNANPVVLDANGEANVWGVAGLLYKFILKDSAGSTIWTIDNISAPAVAAPNAQTGTAYTILFGDAGKFLSFTNASAIAVTLPQATGSFASGWWVDVTCLATSVGAVTITPATSTIDGASSYVIRPGQSLRIYSDGTNYQVLRGVGTVPRVNAQTGTTYTVVAGDVGKLVTFTNASAIAVTLAQATGAFGIRWFAFFTCLSTSTGSVTITPTTSTINGAATLVLGLGQWVMVVSDGTNYQVVSSGGSSASSSNSTVNGRLTFESGNAISTSDQTAKTLVYFTPDKGNSIALYDGVTSWSTITFTEKSVKITDAQTGVTTNGSGVINGLTDTSQLCVGMAVSGTNVGGGAVISTIDSATQVTVSVNSTGSASNTMTFKIPASTAVDVFGFNNLGTLKLEIVITSRTTTTGLALQDGVWVKSGATTRRYLGMVCTTTTAGQTQIKFGSSAAGGGEAWIGLWNMYNRVAVTPLVRDSTASWTYATNTWRSADNSATNRISCVRGMDEDGVYAEYCSTLSSGSAGSNGQIGVGLDSTSSPSVAGTNQTTNLITMSAPYAGLPGIGFHYLQALENSVNSATITYVGDGSNSSSRLRALLRY